MEFGEKVKKGLQACSADECHGNHVGCTYQATPMCIMNVCADALAYIRQLEAEKYQLATEAQKLREERDRYWQYIKSLGCDTCSGDCDRCEVTQDRVWTGWKWNGNKEE